MGHLLQDVNVAFINTFNMHMVRAVFFQLLNQIYCATLTTNIVCTPQTAKGSIILIPYRGDNSTT